MGLCLGGFGSSLFGYFSLNFRCSFLVVATCHATTATGCLCGSLFAFGGSVSLFSLALFEALCHSAYDSVEDELD